MLRFKISLFTLTFLTFFTIAIAQPAKLGGAIGTVKTINGQIIPLKPGKPFILDFFSTTCVHCQRHSPHLSEIARKYEGKVTIISFAADGRTRESDIRAYINTFHIANPVAYLTNDIIAEFLPVVRSVPQMLLFDAEGNFSKRILGWDEGNSQKSQIETWLKTVTATSVPTPKSTKSHRRKNR